MSTQELSRGEAMREVPATSPQVPAENAGAGPVSVLYVATDLSMWRPQRPEWIARDCQIDDRCYRRLDPEYFAWLKFRMHSVKAAADAGRLPAQAFGEARRRFNDMQVAAVAMFGEAALLEAVRSLDADGYRPPLPDGHEPSRPAARVSRRPSLEAERIARARQLVDEIRDQALALGWTMDSLYFSDGYERRPFAARYGLVCYIHAQDRIGEVARQSIELIGPPPLEVRSRFYNPDVEQPWIITSKPSPSQ